jgi:hypothetical protein
VGHDILNTLSPSWDFDYPPWDCVYDGAPVSDTKRDQKKPAELPHGTLGKAWVRHRASEMFNASDWREPLIALMGKDAYRQARAAFTRATSMVVECDWVVGTGCIVHACAFNKGAVAIRRKGGESSLRSPMNVRSVPCPGSGAMRASPCRRPSSS